MKIGDDDAEDKTMEKTTAETGTKTKLYSAKAGAAHRPNGPGQSAVRAQGTGARARRMKAGYGAIGLGLRILLDHRTLGLGLRRQTKDWGSND